MLRLKATRPIAELLTCDSPNKDRYRKLAFEQMRLTANDTAFSGVWEIVCFPDKGSPKPKVESWFTSKLRDKLLIDLGAGCYESRQVMERISRMARVAHYVGVDNFDWNEEYRKKQPGIKEPDSLTITLVLSDMLEFVSKLEDGCANFTINGIDETRLVKPNEYSTELAREIARAVEPGGIVFGINSWVLRFLEENGFRRVDNRKEVGTSLTRPVILEKFE